MEVIRRAVAMLLVLAVAGCAPITGRAPSTSTITVTAWPTPSLTNIDL